MIVFIFIVGNQKLIYEKYYIMTYGCCEDRFIVFRRGLVLPTNSEDDHTPEDDKVARWYDAMLTMSNWYLHDIALHCTERKR